MFARLLECIGLPRTSWDTWRVTWPSFVALSFWLLIFLPGKGCQLMMPKDIYKIECKCRLYQGFSESISLLLIQDHFTKYPGLHLFVLQSKPESRMLLIWRTTSATGGPENSSSIAYKLSLVPITKASVGLLPGSVYFPQPSSHGVSWLQGQ